MGALTLSARDFESKEISTTGQTQAVASRLDIRPLSSDYFPELATYGLGFESSTPLLYYVLRESQLTQTTQADVVIFWSTGQREHISTDASHTG
jgi:hypothetical protein